MADKMDEQRIAAIVESVRAALTEKLLSSRALKEAYLRDVAANGGVRDVKETLRNVSFDDVRE